MVRADVLLHQSTEWCAVANDDDDDAKDQIYKLDYTRVATADAAVTPHHMIYSRAAYNNTNTLDIYIIQSINMESAQIHFYCRCVARARACVRR